MQAEFPSVEALTLAEFRARLRGGGLGLRIGPFDFRMQARVAELHEPLYTLYSGYPVLDHERVFSAHVQLRERRSLRMGFVRKVRFSVDGRVPHEDMPAEQAIAVLEWGINLVIALRFHCFLMLHAAVLERNGFALLMPAAPGSGKTTLCAALAHRGWRLLSDEFGLLRPGTVSLIPIPRPMPLKNQSIGVIRAFLPQAILGPEIPGTRKGTVAHVRPPASSFEGASRGAPGRWIVFPQWMAGAPLSLQPMSKAQGFMNLATNAFNYEKHGESGFETVRSLVDRARCFSLVYSNLSEAVDVLGRLADDDAG
jgi:HprK-related kinase A